MEGDLGASLAFGAICLLFACAGGYLLLQVVEKNMDGKSACAIYAPLLACWFGIWVTMGPLRPVAWGLGILAIAWCILVPYRMATVFRKMENELSDDRIQMLRRSLEKQPDDASSHFKLAELYEERGWLREAYQGYATAATLDRHHVRARIRTAELYKKITGHPFPTEPTTPGSTPSPPPRLDARSPTPVRSSVPPPPAFNPAPSPGAVPTVMVPAAGASKTTMPAVPAVSEPTTRLAPSDPLAEMQAAALRDPSNPRVFAQLAAEFLKAGRPREAADCYRKASALDPANERYRFNLHSLGDQGGDPQTSTPAAEEN